MIQPSACAEQANVSGADGNKDGTAIPEGFDRVSASVTHAKQGSRAN